MLRCEESSRWFSKPCNFTTEKLIPRGCFSNVGGRVAECIPHNQCDVRSLCSASQLKISTRFSLLPSRLGFVHVDKKWASKIPGELHGMRWLMELLHWFIINPKMANGFRFFFGEQKYLELSSCNIFGPVASTSQCLLRARGPQRRRGVAGIFSHPQQRGSGHKHSALITQVNISGGWGIWSFVYMVVKTIKGFPPPQKKGGNNTHNLKPTSIFLLSILINNNHKLQIHYQPELPGWTTLDLRHWLVWSSWQWSWDASV